MAAAFVFFDEAAGGIIVFAAEDRDAEGPVGRGTVHLVGMVDVVAEFGLDMVLVFHPSRNASLFAKQERQRER